MSWKEAVTESWILNHGLTELWITLALFLSTYVSLNKALNPLRLQFLYKMNRIETEEYQTSPQFYGSVYYYLIIAVHLS